MLCIARSRDKSQPSQVVEKVLLKNGVNMGTRTGLYMSEIYSKLQQKLIWRFTSHGLWVIFWVQNWRSLKEVSSQDLSWCHYFWSTSSLQAAFSSTKLFLFILSSSSRLFLLHGTVLFRLKWGTDCLWLPNSPVHTPLLRSTCRRRHGPAPKHAAREAWRDMISPSIVAHAG